jgi:tRNA dimethylallyltransferase
LIRALEVIQLTQKTYSSQRTAVKKDRPFKSIKICLHREREELYKRINQRVDDMMSHGLMDEVKGLMPYQNLKSLNTVGYRELFAYLNGESTLENAIDLIKQNSRRYAKRQLTWFRRDKNYQWFTPIEVRQAIEWIDERIKKS